MIKITKQPSIVPAIIRQKHTRSDSVLFYQSEKKKRFMYFMHYIWYE